MSPSLSLPSRLARGMMFFCIAFLSCLYLFHFLPLPDFWGAAMFLGQQFLTHGITPNQIWIKALSKATASVPGALEIAASLVCSFLFSRWLDRWWMNYQARYMNQK